MSEAHDSRCRRMADRVQKLAAQRAVCNKAGRVLGGAQIWRAETMAARYCAPDARERGLPDGGQTFPALVLNADFRPLSYFPLSLWSWQDAVKAVFLDRVSVLSEYDTRVRSPSCSMRLPSVIALKDYIPSARRPAFTRFNVFLRDGVRLPVLRRAVTRRTT